MSNISLSTFGSGVYIIPKDLIPREAIGNKDKKFKYDAEEGDIIFQIHEVNQEIIVMIGGKLHNMKDQLSILTQYCLQHGKNFNMRVAGCGKSILFDVDKAVQAYNLIISS